MRKLLLVEDDPVFHDLATKALQHSGQDFELVHLESGFQALEWLKVRNRDEPTMVLLDLHMPVIGGAEVLRRLKADQNTADVPVIVLTSSKEEADMRMCRNLGAIAFLSKPELFESRASMFGGIDKLWQWYVGKRC